MSSDPTSSIAIIDPKRSSMLDVYNAYPAMRRRSGRASSSVSLARTGGRVQPDRSRHYDTGGRGGDLADAITPRGSGGDDTEHNGGRVAYATMHIHDLAVQQDFAACMRQ